ncbi:Crp/Fnr family transcriptional regulator [Aquimarina longa]|uniref:Crp/Fnr family transcriptional regulator n=1 Tax=Aquimarina longa TaxID=1080221 RepID=UPI0007814F0D|nr:cyclic nucleotide-binding domain-containing protein [Aquimarina longa]
MSKNQSSLINFIKQTIPMNDIEVEEIANTFHFTKIKKNSLFLKENEISDDYFYLQEGVIRFFLYDLEGNEITTDIFTENNIVFEITSFFNRIRSEVNIHAITDCISYRYFL